MGSLFRGMIGRGEKKFRAILKGFSGPREVFQGPRRRLNHKARAGGLKPEAWSPTTGHGRWGDVEPDGHTSR